MLLSWLWRSSRTDNRINYSWLNFTPAWLRSRSTFRQLTTAKKGLTTVHASRRREAHCQDSTAKAVAADAHVVVAANSIQKDSATARTENKLELTKSLPPKRRRKSAFARDNRALECRVTRTDLSCIESGQTKSARLQLWRETEDKMSFICCLISFQIQFKCDQYFN